MNFPVPLKAVFPPDSYSLPLLLFDWFDMNFPVPLKAVFPPDSYSLPLLLFDWFDMNFPVPMKAVFPPDKGGQGGLRSFLTLLSQIGQIKPV